MKATDLRIGNYHLYHIVDKMDERKEWDEVCQIDYDDLRILTEFKDNPEYKTIPLAPEWLEKFGFEKDNREFAFDKDKLSIHFPSKAYKNGRTYFNSWCILEHSVKYVHELQNLFFALTGTELEVN